jgi:glycine/D-amino acid oxidase-like deaminating enzyme
MPSPLIQIPPDDEYNRSLVAHVHPANWVNPLPDGRYNLVVIGAGTGGLVTALLASSLGAKVALVERYLMGGGLPERRLRAFKGRDSCSSSSAGSAHSAAAWVSSRRRTHAGFRVRMATYAPHPC